MTPEDFNIEKTNTGMQYLIPGTKRPIKSARHTYKIDEKQFVIPEVECILKTECLSRSAKKSLVVK